MMDGNEMTDQPTPREAELAKLADGSLPADREAELRAQVRDSPEFASALAEQERAVALVRSVGEPAPASLRAHVASLTEGSASRRRRRTWRVIVLPAATALAVIIAAVVIVAGGTSAAPSVPVATRLALSAATLPAPAVDPANPRLLRISSDGLRFANWRGWHAQGARVDVVDGRRIVTVFYLAPDGTRVGYAIAARPPLEGDDRHGGYAVSYTLAHQGSVHLVTWVQAGRTCVIAGRSVSYATLLRLARASAAEAS
jgi:hypothetical protein